MTPNVMAYFVPGRSQVQTRRLVIQIEVLRDSSQPLQGFKSGRDHFPPQPPPLSLSHLWSPFTALHSPVRHTIKNWQPFHDVCFLLSWWRVLPLHHLYCQCNVRAITRGTGHSNKLKIWTMKSPPASSHVPGKLTNFILEFGRLFAVYSKCSYFRAYGQNRQAYTSQFPSF